MRQVAEFDAFMKGEVNLDKTRIELLTARVEAMESFISGSSWGPKVIRYSSQGSWAHKTIIKPPGEKGFDADLLVFVSAVDGWTASDYLNRLRSVFEASDRYKEKLAPRRTRCVTVDYAGDFQIDIVPCLVSRPGGTCRYEVCNRTENEFEPTDSEGYTRWLEERNAWSGRDKLREVTRLIKYLRDIKLTFTCKSILLTTLLGQRIDVADLLNQATQFGDLPTALRTVLGRLDNYLQARPDFHDVLNPVLPQESFVRYWDEDKYATFREMIHKYRAWIDDAYLEADEAESITKWQRVFGDEFARNACAGRNLSEAAVTALPALREGQDAVSVVQLLGRSVLDAVRTDLPWIKPVQWYIASPQQRVSIKAAAHIDRNSPAIAPIESGRLLSKGLQLRFEAFRADGISYASQAVRKDYEVHWQVVNTDKAALNADGLRGGFYRSDPPGVRWERTSYRGVHWVEGFVIRMRDKACIGRTGRFFIVIE